MWFSAGVAAPRIIAQSRRSVDRLHRVLGDDARRLREDAGLRRSAVGEAAGVDPTYLARIEDGLANPTLDVYARIAAVLGADLGARLYPNTGPLITDRHQARILEWILAQCHARWTPYTEVSVRNPARGRIDLVLQNAAAACVAAAEIQSQIGRLEQLVRWSGEKVAALPSWNGYAHLGPVAMTSSLLIVRSSRTTRTIGRQFARQLEAAFPAHPQDAIAALTGTRPWPGSALVWVDLRADSVRFISTDDPRPGRLVEATVRRDDRPRVAWAAQGAEIPTATRHSTASRS